MKLCTTCNTEKPLSEFYPRHTQRGYYSNCKNCSKAAQKIWRVNNRDKMRLISRRAYHRTRIKVLTHYSDGSPKCKWCGETDIVCLSIDHIKGGGTQHRKALGKVGTGLYQWFLAMKYPKGFQVLYMNCQFRKRMKNKETSTID